MSEGWVFVAFLLLLAAFEAGSLRECTRWSWRWMLSIAGIVFLLSMAGFTVRVILHG